MAKYDGESDQYASSVGQVATDISQSPGEEVGNPAMRPAEAAKNTANAERNAGASEESSAQAKQMKEIVDQLASPVGGVGRTRRIYSDHLGGGWSRNHGCRSSVSAMWHSLRVFQRAAQDGKQYGQPARMGL